MRFALAALALTFASPASAADKPNIVFILADDMGTGDVRCLNPNGKILTPHLDRLAAAGMTFTDAHSPSAVCSPTRYGVMTGRYAWRSKLKSGVLGGLSPRLIEPGRLTVAQLLKDNGYHTACVGKWHLGMDWVVKPGKAVSPLSVEAREQVFNVEYDKPITNGPNAVGFDTFVGIAASLDMVPYAFIENDRVRANLTEDRDFVMLPGKPGTTRKGPAAPGFLDTDVLPALTRKAVSYIDERAKAGGPLFLYLPFASPHTPVAPDKEWAGKSGLTPYADFVMQTDAAIGQVLRALDKHNLTNDTLVIFTSDNGFAPAADLAAHLKLGHNPNHVFRGHKADIYEGGHRVPFLVRWPGKVKPGAKSDSIACLTDLLATCADIVGKKLPADAGEDSVSLLPALGVGKGPARETLVMHSVNGSFAVRDGKWKLCLCPGSGGWSAPRPGKDDATNLPPVQLFDLSADIGETTNLHATHPDVVERLTKLAETYAADGRSTPGEPQKNTTPVDVWKAGRDAMVPLRKK